MSKIRFAIPVAMALSLSVVSFLSCSKADEAIDDVQNVVDHAKCAKNQGDWDANLKKCVKCLDGMSLEKGVCVAPAASEVENDDGSTTIFCPPKTKLVGDRCVANIIATDTNVVAGKFFCDYGKPDPKEENRSGIGCFPIEFEEECDEEWGVVVKSCNAGDRRKDQAMFCDYGPIDPKHGGGCYRILDESACDTDWGIIAAKCGTQGRWPDGNVCPAGKTEVLDECRKTSEIGDKNSLYCDYGPFKLNKLDELEGGCWEVGTSVERTNCLKWGKGVNKCPVYTCPAGTIEDRWAPGDGGFGCVKDPSYKPSSSSKLSSSAKAPSSSSVKANSSSSAAPSTPTNFCDYGYVSSTDIKVDDGGGCYEIEDESECDLEWGKFVKSCKASDRRTDLEYCDYGEWSTYEDENGDEQIGGGCWPIRNAKDKANCDTKWAKIVKKCTWLNP